MRADVSGSKKSTVTAAFVAQVRDECVGPQVWITAETAVWKTVEMLSWKTVKVQVQCSVVELVCRSVCGCRQVRLFANHQVMIVAGYPSRVGSIGSESLRARSFGRAEVSTGSTRSHGFGTVTLLPYQDRFPSHRDWIG